MANQNAEKTENKPAPSLGGYCTECRHRYKADEKAALVTDKSWNLGRPWQNEPRAYYLNTKMEVLCSDAGWTNMSSLPTHFYEYNSTDKNGNAIDLSVRKNSPTSTNSYKPVLTEDEAQRFTLRNVLGGTDSWDAATFTKQCAAPADAAADGAALQWAAVENALCYVVFKDGEYAGNTTATSFNLSAAGTYSVRAANAMGGMGEPSAPVEVKTVTSVSTVSSCEERGVYKKTQNGQLVIVSPQGVFSASGSRLK